MVVFLAIDITVDVYVHPLLKPAAGESAQQLLKAAEDFIVQMKLMIGNLKTEEIAAIRKRMNALLA